MDPSSSIPHEDDDDIFNACQGPFDKMSEDYSAVHASHGITFLSGQGPSNQTNQLVNDMFTEIEATSLFSPSSRSSSILEKFFTFQYLMGGNISYPRSPLSTTFLMHAVLKDNRKAVEYLIENGVDMNVTDDSGNNALIYPLYLASNQQAFTYLLLLLSSSGINARQKPFNKPIQQHQQTDLYATRTTDLSHTADATQVNTIIDVLDQHTKSYESSYPSPQSSSPRPLPIDFTEYYTILQQKNQLLSLNLHQNQTRDEHRDEIMKHCDILLPIRYHSPPTCININHQNHYGITVLMYSLKPRQIIDLSHYLMVYLLLQYGHNVLLTDHKGHHALHYLLNMHNSTHYQRRASAHLYQPLSLIANPALLLTPSLSTSQSNSFHGLRRNSFHLNFLSPHLRPRDHASGGAHHHHHHAIAQQVRQEHRGIPLTPSVKSPPTLLQLSSTPVTNTEELWVANILLLLLESCLDRILNEDECSQEDDPCSL